MPGVGVAVGLAARPLGAIILLPTKGPGVGGGVFGLCSNRVC